MFPSITGFKITLVKSKLIFPAEITFPLSSLSRSSKHTSSSRKESGFKQNTKNPALLIRQTFTEQHRVLGPGDQAAMGSGPQPRSSWCVLSSPDADLEQEPRWSEAGHTADRPRVLLWNEGPFLCCFRTLLDRYTPYEPRVDMKISICAVLDKYVPTMDPLSDLQCMVNK